jgi:hypothetical protein
MGSGFKNMNRLLYIAHFSVLAVLLLMLSSLAQAIEPIVVRQGEITDLNVDQLAGDTYSWDIYNDSTVNFAIIDGTAVANGDARFINGNNTGTAVQIEWLKPGIFFFKVTAFDITGCTNNLKMGIVKVLEALPTANIAAPDTVCAGDPITLEVTLTGTGPWGFTYTDGTNQWTETVPDVSKTPPVIVHSITIDPGPTTTTEYWVTSVTDKYGTNLVPSDKATQVVDPLPEPSAIYHR